MSRLPLFLATARAALRPDWPHYLILFVTSRCNARCRMCFNWQALERAGEGDLELKELRAIAGLWPGLIQLTLSGGEPFLRDDLVEVVEAFVRQAGVRQLTIPTNGILTERISAMTADILRRFPELPFNLNLSLDAIGEEHDRIRQAPGAFSAALSTLEKLKALRSRSPNLRLGVTAVLSARNQDRILETLNFLEPGLGLDRCQVELARGQAREPDSVKVPLARYQAAADWLAERGRSGGSAFAAAQVRLARRMREVLIRTARENRMIIPCLAGRQLLVVEADGTVRPCEILHTLDPQALREGNVSDPAMGNLRRSGYRIAEVLDSSPAQKIQKFIAERRCHCTYECALFASLVFNPRQWGSVLFA